MYINHHLLPASLPIFDNLSFSHCHLHIENSHVNSQQLCFCVQFYQLPEKLIEISFCSFKIKWEKRRKKAKFKKKKCFTKRITKKTLIIVAGKKQFSAGREYASKYNNSINLIFFLLFISIFLIFFRLNFIFLVSELSQT